jgi:hypothetical protein
VTFKWFPSFDKQFQNRDILHAEELNRLAGAVTGQGAAAAARHRFWGAVEPLEPAAENRIEVLPELVRLEVSLIAPDGCYIRLTSDVPLTSPEGSLWLEKEKGRFRAHWSPTLRENGSELLALAAGRTILKLPLYCCRAWPASHLAWKAIRVALQDRLPALRLLAREGGPPELAQFQAVCEIAVLNADSPLPRVLAALLKLRVLLGVSSGDQTADDTLWNEEKSSWSGLDEALHRLEQERLLATRWQVGSDEEAELDPLDGYPQLRRENHIWKSRVKADRDCSVTFDRALEFRFQFKSSTTLDEARSAAADANVPLALTNTIGGDELSLVMNDDSRPQVRLY